MSLSQEKFTPLIDIVNRKSSRVLCETQSESQIKIIDNIGIRRGLVTVDVIAEPINIHNYLLDQVKKRAPNFTADAEKLINGLTISFGARSFDELEKEIRQIWKKDNFIDPSGWKLPWGPLISTADFKGAYSYHPNHPYLFFNIGNIPTDKLGLIWDH